MRIPRRHWRHQTAAPAPSGPGSTRTPVRVAGETRWVRSWSGSSARVKTSHSDVSTTAQGVPWTPGRARSAQRLSWSTTLACARPQGPLMGIVKVDYDPALVRHDPSTISTWADPNPPSPYPGSLLRQNSKHIVHKVCAKFGQV